MKNRLIKKIWGQGALPTLEGESEARKVADRRMVPGEDWTPELEVYELRA